MNSVEILFYSRTSGDIRKSRQTYRSAVDAERELRKAGFTQNPRLPDIWYNEKFFAKVRAHDADR